MEAYLPPFWPTVVLVSLLVSTAGVGWLAWKRDAVSLWVTDRFYYGLPWGSIVVVGVVLLIYLVIQDGLGDFHRPVFLPFVNWSYLYPTGVIFSAFTHASAPHLLGNLTTAVVLAPLAEFIWGHYPDRPSRRFRDHPAIRAFVLFPGAILILGLLTSIFTWGPVIGFSGVVYALAGFTVIKFPVLTIVALLVRSVLRAFGDALFNPVVEATTTTTMTTPAWVGVSYQGHAIGFLAGAFLGVLLLHYRDDQVHPLRLWSGLIVVMIGMSVWAIWGTRGEDVYVLYQGLGFALIFIAALLIVVAAIARDRVIRGWVTHRRVAVVALLIPILVIAGMAMPLNVLAVTDYEPPDRAVSVDGYDIFYDAETESQLRPVLYDDAGGSNASGIIIVNEERYFWTEAVSSDDLAYAGEGEVSVGGIMERVDLAVNRTAWDPAGNASVYKVDLEENETTTPLFGSQPSTAEHVLDGHTITLAVDGLEEFIVRVSGPDGGTEEVSMPAANASATVGEVTLERESDSLYATTNDTRVRIAERSTD